MVATGARGYRSWFGRNVIPKKPLLLSRFFILPKSLEVFGTRVQGELMDPSEREEKYLEHVSWRSARAQPSCRWSSSWFAT